MPPSNRSPQVAVALALAALGLSACGTGGASLEAAHAGQPAATTTSAVNPSSGGRPTGATLVRPTASTASTQPTATPTATAAPRGTASPTPTRRPTKATTKPKPTKPKLTPGPAIFRQGSSGVRVRDLQARLKQIAWFSGDVTGTYGKVTAASVRGFQAKRKIPVTGEVDWRTLDRLRRMTRTPTGDQLYNRVPKVSATGLDSRCLTGHALCISKTSDTLVWVVDGKPQLRLAVRFGSYETPTREGSFRVGWKSAHWVSTIFHTPMPYSMFFSGGQAVHYSADFAARGYAGASHGCVNVRDYSSLRWLYNQVRVGDKVIVYR